MAKTTEKYELMYIINPTLGEEDTAAVVEKFKRLSSSTVLSMRWSLWASADLLMRLTILPKVTMFSSSFPQVPISLRSLTVSLVSLTA